MIVTRKRPKAYVTAHHVADTAAPKIRRAIQRGLAMARVRLRHRDLVRNITSFDAVAAIPWELVEADLYASLFAALDDAFRASGRALVSTIVRKAPREFGFFELSPRSVPYGPRMFGNLEGLEMALDQTNPAATEWAKRQAAELVTRISGESKLAIRAIIQRMYNDGVPIQQAAREIRALIGLTERDALAIDNLRRGMAGRPQAQIERAVSRASAKAIARRADTIARTESMRASNRGQQELWRQAVTQGLLKPDALQRWIITPDELLCPVCSELGDLDPVPLDTPFIGSEGIYDSPPAHPSCRCTLALDLTEQSE